MIQNERQAKLQSFIALQERLNYLSDKEITLWDLHTRLIESLERETNNDDKNIIRLLLDVSSIMLTTDKNKPFQPLCVKADGRRSAEPSDFTEQELDYFALIYGYIENRMLKARVLDILWYRKHKGITINEVKKYLICPYIHLSFNKDYPNNINFINRGLDLALKVNDKDAVEGFKNRVISFLNSLPKDEICLDNIFKPYKVVNLFHEKKIRLTDKEKEQFINAMMKCAEHLAAMSEYWQAIDYYQEAIYWQDKCANKMEIPKLYARIANLYLSYGDSCQNQQCAGRYYEKALSVINRKIAKKSRMNYFSDEAIHNVKLKLLTARKSSLKELHEVKGQVDITSAVESVQKTIQDQDLLTLMKQLVILPSQISFNSILEEATKTVQSSLTLGAFETETLADDGRKIDTTAKSTDKAIFNIDTHIYKVMLWQYSLMVDMIVHVYVLPILKYIRGKHNLGFNDFLRIVHSSSIIPNDRKNVVAYGLYEGYKCNFLVSLHLLVPQIEHLVRVSLKKANALTIHVDENGIETEVSLNSLVEMSEFKKLFGDDLAFEINALLCEPSGLNLRNKVSHGLISEDGMNSSDSVYLWWFCYKLASLSRIDGND